MASEPAHPNKRFPAGKGSTPIERKSSKRLEVQAETPAPHDHEVYRPTFFDMRRTLLLAAFPLEYSDSSWLNDTNSTALSALTSAAAKYRKTLQSFSEQDVAKQYDSYLMSGRQGLFKEANCRRACRLPCWSPEEAAFYSFGLDFPGEVGLEVIHQDKVAIEAEKLEREPVDTKRGSRGIPLELTFSAHLLERLDIIRRAIRANELPDPIRPGQFIRWAERQGMKLPPPLVLGAKATATEIEDWQDRCEAAEKALERIKRDHVAAQEQRERDHDAARERYVTEVTDLKKEVAVLNREIDRLTRDGDTRLVKRSHAQENMQIMLICMAREKYGWDKSNEAAAQLIGSATANVKLSGLSSSTIKRHLEDAEAVANKHLQDGAMGQSSLAGRKPKRTRLKPRN